MRIFAIFLIAILFLGCLGQEKKIEPQISREDSIPKNALKVTPETDIYLPILHSDEYEKPVPLPYPLNTAGAGDSPFITPDGKTLYFTFVPDVNVPPEKQIIDGVSGIYVSRKQTGEWSKPERIILNDDISLDGCLFVQGNEMWFCSARKGNYREVDLYTAEFKDGKWTNWKNAGEKLNVEYEVGEMRLSANGNEL
ncbi:MAG: hypothetical protein ACE5HW_07500, partial [Candidatus Methanofastidiosia archaeon]